MNTLVKKNYFSSSFENLVTFFAREKKISVKEMEEIMKLMKSEIENRKKGA
ncbi:MAG: hypothetical protein R2744_13740 [Bacteroidales bacterium]